MTAPRFLVEMDGLGDWRARLADPEKHWKRGASAMELAVAWTRARARPRGLPAAVAAMLDAVPELAGAALTLAIPELRTPLPGGRAASQTDLWGLLEGPGGRISLGVEGKALEPFDKPVAAWLAGSDDATGPSAGKQERLSFLCERLGLSTVAVQSLRYQLLHRTVAALIEAERWQAPSAVLLVQRFAPNPERPADSWPDFAAFATALGVSAKLARFQPATVPGATQLYLGWLDSPVATDAEIAAAVA